MRSISNSKLNTHSTTTTTSFSYSLWHSPVPYLFGGLAAIMGLIALALLVLACSYFGLSNNHQDGAHSDVDNKESDPETKKAYEEKILVIMAGDEKPTFLATPVVLFPDTDKEIDNHVLVPTTCTCSQHRQ